MDIFAIVLLWLAGNGRQRNDEHDEMWAKMNGLPVRDKSRDISGAWALIPLAIFAIMLIVVVIKATSGH